MRNGLGCIGLPVFTFTGITGYVDGVDGPGTFSGMATDGSVGLGFVDLTAVDTTQHLGHWTDPNDGFYSGRTQLLAVFSGGTATQTHYLWLRSTNGNGSIKAYLPLGWRWVNGVASGI